MSEQNSLKQ